MKIIVSFLLFTSLLLAQPAKYQILFSKNKTTAKIIDPKNGITTVTNYYTDELKIMLDAVKMKLYKTQDAMLVDFLAYLKSEYNHRSYFNEKTMKYETPERGVARFKILQVMSVVEINRFRKTQNLPNLLYHETLQEVAQGYADYCTRSNWRSGHTSKEGVSFFERLADKMPNYWGAENLYYGNGTPKNTIEAFKESPGHLANLKTDLHFVAVGVSEYEDGTLIYVQNFAKKRTF